ncbi:hypothetical protein Daudx_2159 [Candidatus Desulforudis audaxviator]|nr:hypothetical protein Daudx_2159 [Candidatus Desulforudis audaxviator]
MVDGVTIHVKDNRSNGDSAVDSNCHVGNGDGAGDCAVAPDHNSQFTACDSDTVNPQVARSNLNLRNLRKADAVRPGNGKHARSSVNGSLSAFNDGEVTGSLVLLPDNHIRRSRTDSDRGQNVGHLERAGSAGLAGELKVQVTNCIGSQSDSPIPQQDFGRCCRTSSGDRHSERPGIHRYESTKRNVAFFNHDRRVGVPHSVVRQLEGDATSRNQASGYGFFHVEVADLLSGTPSQSILNGLR